MYLKFYNLKKEPFNITPDPEMLFLSPSHKEALAAVIYGVMQRKGFVSIIGEVGVGKTTILRSFLERVNKQVLKVIYLFNANISFKALLKTIYQDLGCNAESDDIFEMVNKLQHILIDLYKAGTNVVLIVDEAQNMPNDTLKNLHMLSNLETSTDKLIQVVFSGQPELDEKLNCDMLRQLKQRIVIKVRILPLTREESLAYIQHRLAKTAVKTPDIFAKGALKQIINKAGGIPRVINTLCDNCLITSFGRQQTQVTAKVAKEIIAGLYEEKPGHVTWQSVLIAGALLSIIGLVTSTDYRQLSHEENPVNPAHIVPGPPAVKQVAPVQAALETRVNQAQPIDRQDAEITQEKNSGVVARVVKKGDTLAKLILETYGIANKRLIELVKQNNPEIVNENVIREGYKISFPTVNK